MRDIGTRLRQILEWERVPESEALDDFVARAIDTLDAENDESRPRDSNAMPGGLALLPSGLPAVIVPDIHARPGFVKAAMEMVLSERTGAVTALEALSAGELCVVFLGDAFHSERRGFERWVDAYREYLAGNVASGAMEAEMKESLAAMTMALELKIAFPDRVHFLKGNHENVLNEEGRGNHPFGKFVEEGLLTRVWFQNRYGEETLERYAALERSLPVCLTGDRFMASHAEPARPYSVREVVESRSRSEVVEGLTWTGNDQSMEGSVETMLRAFLPGAAGARYFAGHRAVAGGFALRAGGLFVQLHDPDAYRVAFVPADRDFDSSRDIRSLTR
jgi:hypothetical protein